jgi:hypothetical protein
LIQILLPRHQSMTLGSSELLDPLALHRRTNKGVSLAARDPAHPDVADKAHGQSLNPYGVS